MAHIVQRIFNRLARRGTSEEWLRRERVREESNRWIALEQVWRVQERRARSEELLRGLPPVQGLGPQGRLGTIYTSYGHLQRFTSETRIIGCRLIITTVIVTIDRSYLLTT